MQVDVHATLTGFLFDFPLLQTLHIFNHFHFDTESPFIYKTKKQIPFSERLKLCINHVSLKVKSSSSALLLCSRVL